MAISSSNPSVAAASFLNLLPARRSFGEHKLGESLRFDTRVPEQGDLFDSCRTYQLNTVVIYVGSRYLSIPGPVIHSRRDLNVALCLSNLDSEKQKA